MPYVVVFEGDLRKPVYQGDQGYDIPVQVRPLRQTWYDRLVSFLIREPVYVILPHAVRSLPSGVKIQMQDRVWCLMVARSSARKRGLLNAGGGVIDTGYRGEMFSVLFNMSFVPKIIRQRERYIQLVFFPETPISAWQGGVSNATSRGIAGFGSSGHG